MKITWILLNTLLWASGFAIGLLAGFVVPVVGDVIAVLVVGFLLTWYQQRAIPHFIGNIDRWAKYTTIGLIIGVAIGFVETLLLNPTIGLSEAHIIALPITLISIAMSQYIALKSVVTRGWIWVAASILSIFAGIAVIADIDHYQVINFHLDLLNVRNRDFKAVGPWGLVGGILGLLYGSLTVTSFSIMGSSSS